MEKISNFLATKLSTELNLDNEKKQIIQYGMFAIIQIIVTVATVAFGGIILGVAIEALILMFTASTLRRYSGGAHATTPLRCLFIGTSICLLQAILVVIADNLIQSNIILLILGALIYILSYYMITKYVPVDSVKKPIRSEAKKRRMKKGAKKIINMEFLIVLVLLVLMSWNIRNCQRYIFCIYLGVIWQMFTITELGHKLIYGIDSWFDININILRKE